VVFSRLAVYVHKVLTFHQIKAQIVEFLEEKQKSIEKYDILNLQYNRTIGEYESQIKKQNFEISKLKEDLSGLNYEYDNYKVRAQHAFKKQKGSSPNAETNDDNTNCKLVEECKYLKLTIEQLHDKLEFCK
jgi:hypothetical protein